MTHFFGKIFTVLFTLFGMSSGMPAEAVAELPERKRCSKQADLHTSSKGYARRFEGPIGPFVLERQQRSLAQFIDTVKPRTVLDVGGGHGQNIPVLLEKGCDVTVLGSSDNIPEPLIEFVARDKVAYVRGSLTELPFHTAAFDLCISLRQLSHIPDPYSFLREMSRVANKGILFDYTPISSFNFAYPVFYPVKQLIEGDSRRYRLFSASKIESFLKKEGFSEVLEIRQFCLPIALHRLLKKATISAKCEDASERFGITRRIGAPVLALAMGAENKPGGIVT